MLVCFCVLETERKRYTDEGDRNRTDKEYKKIYIERVSVWERVKERETDRERERGEGCLHVYTRINLS